MRTFDPDPSSKPGPAATHAGWQGDAEDRVLFRRIIELGPGNLGRAISAGQSWDGHKGRAGYGPASTKTGDWGGGCWAAGEDGGGKALTGALSSFTR
jgi:hypothetical protein